MVPEVGFEPTAYWLRVSCSAYWSYSGNYGTDEGFEPPLMVLETTVLPLNYARMAYKEWWGGQDSDLRTLRS